jgi:hypothetical protein
MNLGNAEERSAQHPTTFHIPSREERTSLNIGEYAKLIFDDRERMWVCVTDIVADGYVGSLANDPVAVDMEHGDEVRFRPEHIADILIP